MRVWFNHWFSTAYHIINLMKERGDVYIVGSNKNPQSVVGLACDEWYAEPEMPDEEYPDFCLDFCRRHDIDVLVPRRGMGVIAENAERFETAGIKLLMDTDGDIIGTMADKAETYRYFAELAPRCVPMYFEVTDMDGLRNAYKSITEKYDRACFKLSRDEGAVSFRVIDNSMGGAEGLYKAPGMKISYETAENILSGYNFSKPLMVMPYLTGVEVSADCLYREGGSIIIPRFKSNGRIYTVRYDKEIIDICEAFLKKSGLKMPCNVQFKYEGDTPYLLEVNTRMSGGVQLSCLAAGLNIPRLALDRLYGVESDISPNHRERRVSYIESPVLIEDRETADVGI